MQRGRLRLTLLSFGTVCITTTGCIALFDFDSYDPVPPGPDAAQQQPPSVVDGSSPGTMDGPASIPTEAGPLGCDAGWFCDDFNSGKWRDEWSLQRQGTGSVAVQALVVDRALLMTAPSSEAEITFLNRAIATKNRIVLSALVQVEQNGDGEVDLFGLDNQSNSQAVGLIHNNQSHAFGLEAPTVDSNDRLVLLPRFTFAQPTRVVLDIDFARRKLNARVGDQQYPERSLQASWPLEPVTVRVGYFYFEPERKWVVRYDDVHIFEF